MLTSIRADLLSAISKAQSFDELGRIIVETLATAFDAEVCTIWRRYHDERGSPRLRLLAASAKAPQTLAEEITYAINEADPEGIQAERRGLEAQGGAGTPHRLCVDGKARPSPKRRDCPPG